MLKSRILITVLSLCASAGALFAADNPRAFMLGSSPFYMTTGFFDTPLFENMDEKDIISLHVDDFRGVPWDYFAGTSATLPPTWAAQWDQLAADVHATGKAVYLSLSPLEDRLKLAKKVNADGSYTSDWAPKDSSGCYTFSSDPNASLYQTAYINYCKYLIDLVRPQFFSPALEINYTYKKSPEQKSAFIAWYSGVHAALKQAYSDIGIFPTFTLEWLYGVGTNPGHGATPYDDYLRQELAVALSIPQDRTAFSSYPIEWSVKEGYMPTNTFAIVASMTSNKIWITETGWQAVRIPNTNDIGDAYPAPPADEFWQNEYMKWILQQAEAYHFEAVIWWLNRDYLHGPTAASQWLPVAGDAHTVYLMGLWNTLGGQAGVLALRLFANIGLHNYDGTPRAADTAWRASFALARPLKAVSISPARVRAGGTVTITFTGEGILGAVRAKLSRAGQRDIPASAYTVYADTSVVCSFDLAGVAPGEWDAALQFGSTTAAVPGKCSITDRAAGPSADIYAYPNPYRPSSGGDGVTFRGLSERAVVRVFTVTGELLREMRAAADGSLVWDGKSGSGAPLASGVYVYVVTAEAGETVVKRGKIAVIR